MKSAMQPENHSTCYTLDTARIETNGGITVKIGWVEFNGVSGEWFCDGVQYFGPDHPDYRFWKWIIEQRFKAIVDTNGLKELRMRFEKQVQRA